MAGDDFTDDFTDDLASAEIVINPSPYVVAGWPCALLPAIPPSVADKLAAPSADDILSQLLQLTPRGAAWGTDEAGSGLGAQPVMLSVWRAIAAHAAAEYAVDFELATQCFPSAITYSLPDWENEYELPDSCNTQASSTSNRIAAVRSKFGALGGQSPAYFVCLAASLGYDVTIEEPNQFICDDSVCVGTGTYEGWFYCDDGECAGTLENTVTLATDAGQVLVTDDGSQLVTDVSDVLWTDTDPTDLSTCIESFVLGADPDTDDHDNQVSDETVWKFWIVHVASLGDTWFYPDDGECDYDPIEGFLVATYLECVFRRLCPPHTQLVFDYSELLLTPAPTA